MTVVLIMSWPALRDAIVDRCDSRTREIANGMPDDRNPDDDGRHRSNVAEREVLQDTVDDDSEQENGSTILFKACFNNSARPRPRIRRLMNGSSPAFASTIPSLMPRISATAGCRMKRNSPRPLAVSLMPFPEAWICERHGALLVQSSCQ